MMKKKSKDLPQVVAQIVDLCAEMDCGICMEAYNSTQRRPKIFPCGHSACLTCLQSFKEKRCPECRRGFTCKVEKLPDNFTVLRLLESGSRRPVRQWCSDCKGVANPDCTENHNLKSCKAALRDEVVQLQLRAAHLDEKLPEALRQDGDGCPEQAMRVLKLARQPGSTLEVSVRGQRGEALSATWTNPPAAPAGEQGAAEAVEAVATDVFFLALAKKGLWQQRGVKREHEGEAGQGRPKQGRSGPEATPLALPVMKKLEVEWNPTDQRKAELLQIVGRHRVSRLANVRCFRDPAWSLQLLQLAAPHVEELEVSNIRKDHFLAVLAMPRLRRLLAVGCESDDQAAYPAELPPPPAHRVGLRWLGVYHLPRETTFDLVRAHAGTLEELVLTVKTPGEGEKWAWGCDDLPAALGRCGFARLRRLVLSRPGHNVGRCPAQIDAVRAALPQIQVECSWCENASLDF